MLNEDLEEHEKTTSFNLAYLCKGTQTDFRMDKQAGAMVKITLNQNCNQT